MDRNVLVQRGALDIVTILFPFHQSFLLQSDLTSILTAALHTLLKRDISLSRRLYVWLLGTQVLKSSLINCMQPPSSSYSAANHESDGNLHTQDTCNLAYFEKYSKAYLNLSLRGIMLHAAEAARQNMSKVECVLPYRLLRALLDRSEISANIMDSIMLDLVMCLQEQVEALGGMSAASQSKDGPLPKSKSSSLLRDGSSSKKPGKKGSLKADIIQSANLLLGSLSQEYVWGWMATMLRRYLSGIGPSKSRVGGGPAGAGEGSLGVSVRERLSPVSEALDHVLSGPPPLPLESRAKGISDDGDRSLDVKTLLAVLMFLLKVMPKVSSPF